MINNQDVPAFPFAENCKESKPNQLMSLRDYFAASALTGFLSKGLSMNSAVKYSYEAADMMMKERNE